MTDFPSPYVAYAVLSLVGILLLLAGLGALAEAAKKQMKKAAKPQKEAQPWWL